MRVLTVCLGLWKPGAELEAAIRDQIGGEVGTGAGRGDDPVNAAEATSWVNGSQDCPEAPAQAHLPANGGA